MPEISQETYRMMAEVGIVREIFIFIPPRWS